MQTKTVITIILVIAGLVFIGPAIELSIVLFLLAVMIHAPRPKPIFGKEDTDVIDPNHQDYRG